MSKEEESYATVNLHRGLSLAIEIESRMNRVFEMLTTSEGLNAWWTDESVSNPKEGGIVTYVWNVDDGQIIGEGKYIAFQPPESFTVQWIKEDDRAIRNDGNNMRGATEPILQRFSLSSNDPTRTLLHLLDCGISMDSNYDDLFVGTAKGWVDCLRNLKRVSELDEPSSK